MIENQSITDTLENLIGDVPVSEQLGAALERMSEKTHTHDEYALRKELEEVKKQIEKLFDLVGDTSVSEQINAAINKA